DEDRSNIAVIDALKELSQGASIYTEIAELRSRSVAEDVVDSLSLHLRMNAPLRTPRADIFSGISVERTAPGGSYKLERNDAKQYVLTGGAGGRRTVRPGQPFAINGGMLTLAPTVTEQEIEFVIVPFQVAVRDLQRILAVTRPEREADIVEIAYETTDRELARTVPNATAALFIARRQNVKTQEARTTVAFLDDQLDTLGAQMTGLETGLRSFRERARVISPEAEGEAQVNRLARFQAERDLAEAEYRSLAAIIREVESVQVAPGEPSPYRKLLGFPALLMNEAAGQILSSLNEVENQRAQLLTRLTPEDPDVKIMTARLVELEEQLKALTVTYLSGLANRIASLDAILSRNIAALQQIPSKEIEYARLLRQAKVTEEIFTELQSRRKEAQIIAAVQDPSVRVVDPAIMPLRPIKPNKPFNIALALMLGLAIGLAAGFMRETLDTTIHTREELQVESGTVPVLGMIPRIREAGARMNGNRVWWRIRPATVHLASDLRKSRLVAGRNPRGAASEAYRTLRTNIAFARAEKPAKTMVFTSPAPGDGKSTSSSNLAITLAQQGLRAILIDADMRRGAIHEAFDVAQRPGLSDYLLGGVSLEDVIRNVELEGARFDFVPTGTLPPNPAELLASARMQALLEHLDGEYDAVIFDAPPLNVVTDAAILGSRADGVIVVVRAGITDRGSLRYALSQLEAVQARVLGCVLNDVDIRRERHHGAYIDDRYYEVGA
ncbi:MAG TPA: polysaccharide biosynthesis tyrosine autokinase, partial [Longimicrobiales bacterium]|nr:polysaccharide biosynthesis tyrosine autokinase [Longimicrobiales bacterium]